jgi:hypothetical protein
MREEHIGIYAIIDIMFKKLQCHMCHIPIDSPECNKAQELKGYPGCINKYYDFKLKTKGRLKTMNKLCQFAVKKSDSQDTYLCTISELSVCPYKGNNKRCQIFVDAESM